MDSLHSAMATAGYRIDGTLGEGGMGAVYRATQLSLERVVALKVLTVELSSDPAFRARFRREGLLQAALDHPNIVTVYEAGDAENRLFLAMRMVEGPTLKELIQRRELDDRRSLRLLTQVAEALDAAHERGLIHRDVKPHNVLVGAGDHAYLADFGLTKANDDAAMTETGQFVGTIEYISPEQARGELATARSDVYALTAVLCECLTGQVPYVRATDERVLLAHLSDPPPRLSQLRPELPAAIDEVIAEGMAKDPRARPASAGDLILKARQALGALPATPRSGSPGATPPRAGNGTATRAADVVATGELGAGSMATAARAASAPTRAAAGPTAPARASKAPPRSRFAPAALTAIVLAGAAGFLLGSGAAREAFTNSASAGYVEVSYPTGWQRLASAPAIPGLPFAQALALADQRSSGASGLRLLAGEVNASTPSLLPASFTAALSGALPRPEAVRLGALQAYRYRALSVRGLAAPLTLYTVPTANGVATVACLGSSTATAATQCSQIAATLKLNGTTAFGLGPSAQYATALGHILGTLNLAVGAGAAKLHAASSAAAQASAAAQLATAYSTAANALGRLTSSPVVRGLSASLADTLAALARDYSALASAARAIDQGAYARATRAIARDRASVTSALAALNQAGYVVSG